MKTTKVRVVSRRNPRRRCRQNSLAYSVHNLVSASLRRKTEKVKSIGDYKLQMTDLINDIGFWTNLADAIKACNKLGASIDIY